MLGGWELRVEIFVGWGRGGGVEDQVLVQVGVEVLGLWVDDVMHVVMRG